MKISVCQFYKDISSPLEKDQDGSLNFYRYSRFKFGDGKIAKQYGYSLADLWFKERGFDFFNNTPRVVVYSSPFNYIPPAADSIARFFIERMEGYAFNMGFKTLFTYGKIHREAFYSIDYGNLDVASRQKLISSDPCTIDMELAQGNHLVFIDDVIITGTHERLIEAMLYKYRIDESKTDFCYYAQLLGDAPAHIEGKLNYSAISSIYDIVNIMDSPDFMINMRVCKHVFSLEENKFQEFIQILCARGLQSVVLSLQHQASCNKFQNFQGYAANLQWLNNSIVTHYHVNKAPVGVNLPSLLTVTV